MRVAVIANPVSGGGRVRRHEPAVRAAIASRCDHLVYVETTGQGHAARLAADFTRRGMDLVIAFGGDGTASEVVDGILSLRQEPGIRLPQFGIIPAGTGMDFRRNFPIPMDPAGAALHAVTSDARPIDAGLVTFHHPDGTESVRHFLNVASLGISGDIATTVNAAKAKGRSRAGDLVYLAHSLREILSYRAYDVAIEVDGEAAERSSVAVVAIANGGWFGGGMHLAPDALTDDGLFDLVVMKAANRLTLLSHLGKVYGGWHRNSPDISFRKVRSVRIDGAPAGGDRPASLEMDGENAARLPATYSILPKALMLRG